MKRTTLLEAVFGIVLLAASAHAQDRVRMTDLAVDVRIQDGVATTSLQQVLRNDGDRVAEATWILPLPMGAVADQFLMTVGNVEAAGDVLAADEARTIYEGIVRRQRDPGLLEYVGSGCLRARVFPIPAHGEVVVDVGFRHVLPELNGLRRWSFPTRAAGLAGRTSERVSLTLRLDSAREVRTAFSPQAEVHVRRDDDRSATASFAGHSGQLDDGELSFFYGLSEEEFGLDLLSTTPTGEPEGTFLMLISPKREWLEREVVPRSITFVLDTSGSMKGTKLRQAKAALHQFLASLTPQDSFNIVAFSSSADAFFRKPVAANPTFLAKARERIDDLKARGGTNIDQALLVGLEQPHGERQLPIVLFLTDGLPTVGETKLPKLLSGARQRNRADARIYALGIGADVNTILLDTLAEQGGGTRDYVRDGASIEERASALYAQIASPVMTDLELVIQGVRISRVVPSRLPDLFRGGRLMVFGRYANGGKKQVRLSGTMQGERVTLVYEAEFAKQAVAAHDFVPALWAERRVGVLLDAIRLHGSDPELVEEVKQLGREYRIVTPFTSHLIVEDDFRSDGSDGWFLGGGAGGGAAGPTGPSSAGPSGPSSPGAPRGGPSGPTTRGGGGGTYRGPSDAVPPRTLEQLAEQLRAAGVLPPDATKDELRALATEIVRELRSARAQLDGLGERQTGDAALDDSAYLSGLMAGKTGGSRQTARQRLFDLFTQRVKNKVFVLRAGVWTDRAYDEEAPTARRVEVEAFSPDYFELVTTVPELRPYLAFSARLIVVHQGTTYVVWPPADGGAEGAQGR
jgi:Ca-activated chloride channel family protein